MRGYGTAESRAVSQTFRNLHRLVAANPLHLIDDQHLLRNCS
jgi:hypothetical protein